MRFAERVRLSSGRVHNIYGNAEHETHTHPLSEYYALDIGEHVSVYVGVTRTQHTTQKNDVNILAHKNMLGDILSHHVCVCNSDTKACFAPDLRTYNGNVREWRTSILRIFTSRTHTHTYQVSVLLSWLNYRGPSNAHEDHTYAAAIPCYRTGGHFRKLSSSSSFIAHADGRTIATICVAMCIP